ncbi:MAG: hypothetical protein ACYTXC_13230 [Nostoc sp.]
MLPFENRYKSNNKDDAISDRSLAKTRDRPSSSKKIVYFSCYEAVKIG